MPWRWSMSFDEMRFCLGLNQDLPIGFTFMPSSVKMLWFLKYCGPCIINPVCWLARKCCDPHAILECVTRRARKAVHVTPYFKTPLPASLHWFGTRHAITTPSRCTGLKELCWKIAPWVGVTDLNLKNLFINV